MDKRVGKDTHFFNHLSAAVLDLTDELKVGSMEIGHQKVSAVGPGVEVALKVYEPVRKGDMVYQVVEG